jgi:hypothetical protein
MISAARRALSGARAVVTLGMLLAAGISRLEAQSADSPALGTWRGQFVTDGPSGIMTVVVTHEAAAWKATNSLESENAPPGGDIRDLKVEGSTVTWAQTFGEFDVIFKATVEGEAMKGSIEAYQGGALVGGGSFELKKQP